MPAPDPVEQTAAGLRHMLTRLDTCIKTLSPLVGAMDTAGPKTLVIRYGKSIKTALNTLEGFVRDANNSYADAASGSPRTLPSRAPASAPGRAKKTPGSGVAKTREASRKTTTKRAAK
jgi:hypothetical protein